MIGRKTCEEAADNLINNGCDRNLVIELLRSTYAQGYGNGYRASTADRRRADESKISASEKLFKEELDTIDDVMKSKWE